jgi:glycosyltransferase involved in cell wall biosynthesis
MLNPPHPHDLVEQSPDATAQELARLRMQLRRTRLRLLAADQDRAALRASNSWQITTPLRRLMQRHPGPARLARRLAWLLVWIGTGELRARLRARRAATNAHQAVAPPAVPPTDATVPPMLPLSAPSSPRARTILMVESQVPHPDRDAGSRTIFRILSLLRAEGWSVAFWPYDHRADAGPYARALEALGVSVVDDRFPDDLQAWLAQHGNRLDHIMLVRPDIALALLPMVLCHSNAVLSYYGHDLHHVRQRQEALLLGDPDRLDAAVRREMMERGVWRAVDVVLYPSSEEAAEVRRLEPGVDARTLPPYSFDDFPPARTPVPGLTLLSVSNFVHTPNVDAACWFVGSVLPHILARQPQARLVLAGSSPNSAVTALAGPQVVVTGQISEADLAGWYENARVAVAPLRFGAGVKGKVVEALHAGLPLVTTSVGAQGLPGLAAIVPMHDDAAAQAEAILHLLSDDDAWRAQSAAQIAYAGQHFSSAVMRRALLAALAGEPLPDSDLMCAILH